MSSCSVTCAFTPLDPKTKDRFIKSEYYAKSAIREQFKKENGDFQEPSTVQTNVKGQKATVIDWNQLFIDLRDFPRALRFAKSDIHRWGVFANEPFVAGEPVIEYKGLIVPDSAIHSVIRSMNPDDFRFLPLKNNTCIEARSSNSLSKYINHSCNPNCEVMFVQERRVLIYAKRNIAPNEELTLNYHMENRFKDPHIKCNCRARNCRGYINYNDPSASKSRVKHEKSGGTEEMAAKRNFLADAQILIPGNTKVTEWLMDMLDLEEEELPRAEVQKTKPKPESSVKKEKEPIQYEEEEEEDGEEVPPRWYVHTRKVRNSDHMTEVFQASMYGHDVLVWGGGTIRPKEITPSETSDDEDEK